MTILEKIRSKPGLTVGIVAGALLLFLIPFDSIANWVNGTDASYTGKVNGIQINNAEYESFIKNAEQQNPNQNAHQQVWESLIMNKLMEKRFHDLGLEMNDDYFWNSIETPKSEYENALKDSKNAPFAVTWKENSEFALMAKAYTNFVANGINANKVEATILKKANSEVANIEYVKIDFNEYNKKVNYKVTNEDLQKYIDKHKLRFKHEAERNLYAVYFRNKPSAKDLQFANANMLAYLNGGMIKDENGTDLDSVASFKTKGDSAYVNTHSMFPYYGGYLKQNELQATFGNELINWAKTANPSEVYGPFTKEINGKTYNVLSKMVEKRLSDSIQSKHILLTTKQKNPKARYTAEQAMKLADSIQKAIEAKPELFDAMVAKYSEDPGSKMKAGDVGFSSENKPVMDARYQQFIENTAVGKVGITVSQFGIHIVKVTQKIPVSPMKYKLMNLIKPVEPSETTSTTVFNTANKFAELVKGKDLNTFINTAKKQGAKAEEIKNIQRFATPISQLNTDKDNDILKWAFSNERKIGETFSFSTNNQDYIVVYLNGIYPAGLVVPAQVRSEIETIVRNEILAEQIAKKVDSGKKTLDQLAIEFGSTKTSAQVNIFNPSINGGFEPKVAGAAFGVKINIVSKAIKGNAGVYVLVTKSITKNPTPLPIDDKQLLEQLTQRHRSTMIGNNNMQGILQRTMRLEADVVDNRNNVFK